MRCGGAELEEMVGRPLTGSGAAGGAPRRCLGPPGWGRPLKAEGCRGSQLDCGQQSPRGASAAEPREGRGRERRFPDQVGRLGSRGTDGRFLSGSGQCPSSPRLPSKTFWKSYLSFSCALKSRPPARLPTSRCLLVAASSPKAWAPSAPGAGHLFGSAWVPAPELWGSWGSICGVKCWTSRVPFIV